MVKLEVLANSETKEERRILRVNEHIDGGWFWSKYSANPYRGCKFGCSYCFLRQEHYGLSNRKIREEYSEDPFSEIVVPITDAPALLDAEISSLKPDVIIVGDYQPIEKEYGLSRQMLEVCRKYNFPTVVISRSPLVVRDIDIIKKISEETGAAVVFSMAYSDKYRKIFEPLSPSIESRLNAMKKVSLAGIYTGVAAIPILPFITDNDTNLESVVRRTKENGGSFVMAGGLVLDNKQKETFYNFLRSIDQLLVEKYKHLYGDDFSPRNNSWASLGKRVKELCLENSIGYRMKRLIPKSEFEINKKLAEQLFLYAYEMELEEFSPEEINEVKNLAIRIDESTELLTEQQVFDFTSQEINLSHVLNEFIKSS